jgi:hypothetical protein
MTAVDFQWLASLFLGTVFIYSGSAKLLFRAKFRDALSAMDLFPRWLTEAISWIVAPLELALGIATVIACQLRVTGHAAVALLVGFSLVLALYRLRGGKEVACGCFADFDETTATSTLILRNLLLLACAIPLLFVHGEPMPARRLVEWLLALTVAFGVQIGWRLLNRLTETVAALRAASSWSDG